LDVEPEFYARPKDKKENPKRASGEPKHRWEVGRTEFKERETEIKNEQKPPRYDSKGRSLKAKPCGNVSVAFKERRAENKGGRQNSWTDSKELVAENSRP